MPTMWKTVSAIVWKDITNEWRTRQTVSMMFVFSAATAVIFNFAFGARAMGFDLSAAKNAAGGFLWSTILLAGTLGLNRSLFQEDEGGAFAALLMAPVDRMGIYLGKVASLTLFNLATEALLLPLFVVFFDRPFWRPQVIAMVILGTIGFVAAGILVGAITLRSKNRGALLPVLLLPLTLPAIMMAATVSEAYMGDQMPAFAEVRFPLALVIAFDVLMLVAGSFTFQYIVEE